MRFQFNPFTDKLDISGMGPGGTTVQFLTGNDGIPVPSDSGYNINVDGENATGINTTGNAGTNTLTIHGLASTTTQVGTTRYATNAEAAAQGVNSAALTPSNITNFFSNNPVPASQGGTGLSSPAAHSLLVTEGSSAFTRLGVAGNGQIPIGHVGADPVLANITSSGGTITVTNGPGTINIDTSGELVLTFDADSGSAMPSGAVITISGGSTGLTTTGSAATISLAGTLGPTYGGTGVNNGSSTITIGGNVTFSGAHTFTGTVTGTTTVTFPTSGTLLAGTVTQYDVLVGGASSAVASVGPGSAGQVLQSGGNAANPAYSTATYPATATGTGKVLIADGTNWVASTPTFPNASATSGKFIRSDGTNWIASTPTLPTSAGTSGKVLQSDGTNYVESTPTYPSTSGSAGKVLVSDGTNNVYSTPTFPNASATTGKIIISDGTNWIASTPTFPATAGANNNVLTSNGTNWTSAAPASSSITITGDSGGGLTGTSFTFTGGTTGLTFAGASSTETLGGTLAIANGGTDATSFGTSTGIVKYDGTRLVTSSTAKIDSSNRQTNTSQPAFYAYANSASNVTGDGTNYTIAFVGTLFDQNSNFNTGTYTFTAPVAGIYQFNVCVLGQNLVAASAVTLGLIATGQTYYGNNNAGAFVGNNTTSNAWCIKMAASDTATILYSVANGTKSVGIYGSSGDPRTFFSGFLVC